MNEAADLALLFARDPLQHTDQDIDRIISKMREARSQFNIRPATAAKPASKAKPIAGGLDGLDLGL